MEFVLIKLDSIEWNLMWNWLATHPLNQDLTEPSLALNNNEAWMYMGSFKKDDEVISSFRHRHHPITNSIQNISFKHTNFDPNSIEKEIRI